MTRLRSKRLKATVTRNGTLRIEIGIDTLAVAALHSDYVDSLRAYDLAEANRYSIPDPAGFAVDVRNALLDEAEDGSNLVTRALDQAIEQAIENGSESFVDTQEETP